MKTHTHCLAALAAHIQSQPKSVLSAVQVEKVVNGKNAPPHDLFTSVNSYST